MYERIVDACTRGVCVPLEHATPTPDGLKVDAAGRVWCVGSGGIWVMASSGEVIGMVQTPEVVRNLAFGGPDFRTLYLTPGGSLAQLEVTTPGIGASR